MGTPPKCCHGSLLSEAAGQEPSHDGRVHRLPGADYLPFRRDRVRRLRGHGQHLVAEGKAGENERDNGGLPENEVQHIDRADVPAEAYPPAGFPLSVRVTTATFELKGGFNAS